MWISFSSFAAEMENMEKEILDKAKELFHRYGLRPVTMDDIAKEMSVSKKTLYKYFSNKEELVSRSVDDIFENIKSEMLTLLNGAGNAIDMLFAMDEVVCTNIERHDHSMQFQLERYYPEVSAYLESKKRELVFKMMRANIERGIQEGLFRQELDKEIVAFLYYSRTRTMTEADLNYLSDRSIPGMMREILVYHIRGISNQKGVAYLEEKLKTTTANT